MVGERLAPVRMRAVADDRDQVAARVADPDRRRRLFDFDGPFGSAALSLSVAHRNVAVHGEGVAPLTLDAAEMGWPPSAGALAAGVSGTVEGSVIAVRARMASWRPSRRAMVAEVNGVVTHVLRKTPWREELLLTATRTGRTVGSTVPVAIALDASPLDTALVLFLSTLDLLDRMTFAHGILRYL